MVPDIRQDCAILLRREWTCTDEMNQDNFFPSIAILQNDNDIPSKFKILTRNTTNMTRTNTSIRKILLNHESLLHSRRFLFQGR
jgi:hypothetical protein